MGGAQLKEKIISEGIREAQERERGASLRGAVLGLETCRNLTAPEDFERLLNERRRRELLAFEDGAEEREEHTAATLQIEYVYRLLRIHWKLPGMTFTTERRKAQAAGFTNY